MVSLARPSQAGDSPRVDALARSSVRVVHTRAFFDALNRRFVDRRDTVKFRLSSKGLGGGGRATEPTRRAINSLLPIYRDNAATPLQSTLIPFIFHPFLCSFAGTKRGGGGWVCRMDASRALKILCDSTQFISPSGWSRIYAGHQVVTGCDFSLRTRRANARANPLALEAPACSRPRNNRDKRSKTCSSYIFRCLEMYFPSFHWKFTGENLRSETFSRGVAQEIRF